MKSPLLALSLCLAVCVGCASNPQKYNYVVEPTPLTQGESQYELQSVNVNLTLGHGAEDGETQFASEAQMRDQFEKALREELNKKSLLASQGEADAALDINIDYLRVYNVGGNALNVPKVSHTVKAFKGNQEIANFSMGTYMVTHGIASNMKIAAFQWKAEDELKDIQKIAALLAKDIEAMGQ